MKLTTIIIGDEILIGQVTDSNSGAVARTFVPDGWDISKVITTGDNERDITAAVEGALAASELVIVTGGLGPTKDDITKKVLMNIFGGELVRDGEVTENIRRVFERRGLQLNALTEDQALVPSSCRVIQNRLGTAPVMWFERDGHVLVSMPGVPFETEGALPEVRRLVREHFSPEEESLHATILVSGITESALAQRLEDFENGLGEGLHLAYLPQPGLIRLRLDGRGPKGSDIASRHEGARRQLVAALGELAVHEGDDTPAAIVLDALRQRGLTLATAESCTGGNIAHRITSVAGSSDVFLGSVVSYSNSVKEKLLGVDAATLETVGAVSREVVEQMAAVACRATGADCAVATSGIAGPGGGSAEKPVGTVWMAWAYRGNVVSRVFRFPGDRARVIERATTEALLGILKNI